MYNNELIFTVCDVKKQVTKILKDAETDILADMNEENRKGYDFGISTILNILENVISVAEEEDGILVNKTGITEDIDFEECDLHDLLNKFDGRVTAERN